MQCFPPPATSYLLKTKAKYIAFHLLIHLYNAPEGQLSTSFFPHTYALKFWNICAKRKWPSSAPIVGLAEACVFKERNKIQEEQQKQERGLLFSYKNWRK